MVQTKPNELRAAKSVVVIYEDPSIRERAVNFCGQLIEEHQSAGLNMDWWSFPVLAEPAMAHSAVEKAAYYELLGAAQDRTLAQKTLDFALTGKAGTTSAAIITSVAAANPDLAFDFTVAHQKQAEALVDDSGKARFYQRLVGNSVDPAMVGKLETLRAALPEDQRAPIDQALASLKDRLETYPRLRMALHDWLAAHAH